MRLPDSSLSQKTFNTIIDWIDIKVPLVWNRSDCCSAQMEIRLNIFGNRAQRYFQMKPQQVRSLKAQAEKNLSYKTL